MYLGFFVLWSEKAHYFLANHHFPSDPLDPKQDFPTQVVILLGLTWLTLLDKRSLAPDEVMKSGGKHTESSVVICIVFNEVFC